MVTRIKLKFIDGFVDEKLNLIGYGLKEFMTDVGGLLGMYAQKLLLQNI